MHCTGHLCTEKFANTFLVLHVFFLFFFLTLEGLITAAANDILTFLLYFVNENKLDISCVCLCWGFTAQSTQWGHVELGQFT